MIEEKVSERENGRNEEGEDEVGRKKRKGQCEGE